MALSDYRLENLSRSTQIVIFAALAVCLAVVFYMYFLKGRIAEREVLQAEVERLEIAVAQGAAIESQLKRFKEELVQLEERLKVLQEILPAEKETPLVLRSVQQMATSSDLDINKFTPQPIIPRAFHVDWPIVIEVEGNYNGLGMFFEKVSQSTRLIDVNNISIKGLKEFAGTLRTLNATCTATTFVFSEGQVVAEGDRN